LYASLYEEPLGLDWNLIVIPPSSGFLQLDGESVNYFLINKKDVNSISIGYGRRKFYVIKTPDSNSFGKDILNIDDSFVFL